MKEKTFLIIMFFILVVALSKIVVGVGVCTLDKFDYHPGETAVFSCSCNIPNEENQDGFIVFQNSTGFILQNNSANSGPCRTSFFTGSYTFLVGQNFTGNATFSLYGNGTGTPINWGGAGDVTSDDFNVSGGNILDCVITNITSSSINLGDVGSVKICVEDGITGNKLVHVSCQAEGYDIHGFPLIFEPYGPLETSRISGSGGEVGFQRLMNEIFWDVSTTYLFEFHCHCLDNESDEACYDETTGNKVGFKSCTAQTPLVTSNLDYRDVDKSLLPVIFVIVFTSVFFLFAGFTTPKLGFKVASIGVGIIELIILSFIIWINRDSNTIISILRMNFYILLTLGFGIGFIGLIFFVIRIMNPSDDLTGEGDDKKWSKK